MSEEGEDAARISGHGDDETIRTKILGLLPAGYDAILKRSTFLLMPTDTKQLQSLRAAKPRQIPISAYDTDYLLAERGKERDMLTKYDIDVDRRSFLRLPCQPKKFYVREGYLELYECICEFWNSEENHVVLLGNAGTGKSWFQVYALKQLMSWDKGRRDFDIVIRQVQDHLYLIDLDEAMVYQWITSSQDLSDLSVDIRRTLYFFEPGRSTNLAPRNLLIPSLSTLSPNNARTHQYEKDSCMVLYFWPWSSGELKAVIGDSITRRSDDDTVNPPIIDDEMFIERYYKFGGIVTHVLGEDQRADGKLQERLGNISIDILTSTSLNVDRDRTGYNVSGFLICYDNRSVKGKDRFAAKILKYTSAHVEDRVKLKFERIR